MTVTDHHQRTLAAAAVALSVPTHMSLINAGYIIWITGRVLTLRMIPELWRLVTPFLLTGRGLGLIFDPYFLYLYGSQLERGSPRFSGPGDFLFYVIFLCTMILVSTSVSCHSLAFVACLSATNLAISARPAISLWRYPAVKSSW